MRPSEPLLLDRDDVDLQRGVLTVRQSKFGKSRYLPVHETTTQALQTYAVRRDRLCPRALDPAFFLSERRSRISPRTLQETFVKLSGQVGSLGPTDSRGPRRHDLCHRFAVSTLRRWQRDGLDVEGRIPRLATYLGHARVSDTYWYLTADPALLQLAARRLERTAKGALIKPAADFPRLLASLFSNRLRQQLRASPHTVASYRDTFRLLVGYTQRELKKAPVDVAVSDLDTAFVGAFPNHLGTECGNSARTRNTRLAAIRSFFGYVALHEPLHAALAQRVPAMPSKRCTRRPVDFLDRDEAEALPGAPDTCTRSGRRDRTLLLVAVQTGLLCAGALMRCASSRTITRRFVGGHGT